MFALVHDSSRALRSTPDLTVFYLEVPRNVEAVRFGEGYKALRLISPVCPKLFFCIYHKWPLYASQLYLLMNAMKVPHTVYMRVQLS